MSRSAALIPILFALLPACSEAPESHSTDAGAASAVGAAATSEAAGEFDGLLSDLTGESVKRLHDVRKGRGLGKELSTALPDEIDFAPDIYTAIEWATELDKPILMTSVVTKGGRSQPDCDV